MPMSDLLFRPLTQQIDALVRRSVSAVELMRETLARIDATRDTLNSFSAVAERDALLAEARAADQRIASGDARPLEGIPLGVKDLFDARGLVTSMGSIPFQENLASEDSVQVARLRAAGAIVVGKTNVPEFGHTAITKNLLHGVSRNPWDLERTPGGSSGGSAAAIAGGVVSLVTASDGGGSIRLPASFTGCFGLKPSWGRIPNERDHWVMDDTAVQGPLTRTVEDAALFLDLTAGVHPSDPNSLPDPGISYRAVLGELSRGLRVGYSPDLGYAVVQSDVAEVAYDAARFFAQDHRFEEIEGGPPQLGRKWGMLGAFEGLGEIERLLPEHEKEFGRGFLEGMLAGRRMTPAFWAEIRREREKLNRWCAEMFARYDLLLTPTVPFDPPPARGPLPAETEGRKQPAVGVASFTIPWNLAWHPAATVRAGFSQARLPVGLQIAAPRHRDELVLQAAHAFERARPWADDWPRPQEGRRKSAPQVSRSEPKASEDHRTAQRGEAERRPEPERERSASAKARQG
ncbi:MAG: amidase [Deltaproteobacteria bacterium]|nr:MAG: amidase [Deltaproteobacteria bacterium]